MKKSVRDKSESVKDTSVPTERTTEETDTIEKNKRINLAADSQTSPFGFGPYPEVPADYPFQERLWDNATPEYELLVRVRVKLWKQGTKTKGAKSDMNNGLIYPSIPGVIYVQWRYVEEGIQSLQDEGMPIELKVRCVFESFCIGWKRESANHPVVSWFGSCDETFFTCTDFCGDLIYFYPQVKHADSNVTTNGCP